MKKITVFLKLPLPNSVSCVAHRMARLLIVMHNSRHVVSEGCRRTQMEFDHAISLQHGNLTMSYIAVIAYIKLARTRNRTAINIFSQ